MIDNSAKLFDEFEKQTKEQWKEKVIADLNGSDFSKKMLWNMLDGIETEPLYVSDDISKFDFTKSFPGQFPFVRGNHNGPNTWKICQTISTTDIQLANQEAKDAILGGADCLTFVLDFLDDERQIEKLLNGIDITKIFINFTGSHSYSILIGLLSTYCKSKSIAPEKFHGSLNFDPFSYYLLHGEYYNSKIDNLNELKCLLKTAIERLPNFSIININGLHFHNAGSSITQELGYSIASAHEYLVEMLNLGLEAKDILPRISFTFGIGSSYFPEIAKLRAARFLWSKTASAYTTEKDICKATIHSVSSSWNKSIYDSNNNILRATTEAMSAIIGGSNIITTLPHDMCYKKSDEFSSRVARNIQNILKEESYLNVVSDPSGGSYYIENLTASVSEKSWNIFLDIEEQGGFCNFIESKKLISEIEKVAQQRDVLIATRKTTILGVNQYPNLNEMMVHKISVNYKEQKNGNILHTYRGAEKFEELRLTTGNYIQNGGIRPKVYLAQFGNLAMRKARAQFSLNFFGIVGFEIIDADPVHAIEWTVKDIIKQKADIVVLCSSDEEYAEIAPSLTQEIKHQNSEIKVIVAGNPVELLQMLKNSGVDDFIHIKINTYEFLKDFQQKLGIKMI